MARQQAEHFAEGVRGEGGARGAGLLAPDFLAVELEDVLGFHAQQRDLFLGEAIGEENVALFVEGSKLLGVELHGRRSLIRLRPVVRLLRPYFRARAAKRYWLARRRPLSWRGAATGRRPATSLEPPAESTWPAEPSGRPAARSTKWPEWFFDKRRSRASIRRVRDRRWPAPAA